jgi:hypothetical protein
MNAVQFVISFSSLILHPFAAPLPERNAPINKHTVITLEKAMGIVKKYIQLKRVTAAKQTVKAHALLRISRRVSAGRLLSCHASIAASSINTLTNKPNPT